MSNHIEKIADKIGHEVASYQTNVAMTAETFDKHKVDDMPSQVDNRQAKNRHVIWALLSISFVQHWLLWDAVFTA